MLEQLGKYRIDSVLGKGAMGTVYKAFDPHIARAVALKTIRKELFGDGQQAELIARFRNEAQAAGRLMHPNVVAVHDYGEDDDVAYIAMEFVDGRALSGMLHAGQPTAPARALDWIEQLLRALDYAHAHGVIHRDIKPANLMVTSAGQVKITDFGIARIESSLLTQTGAMIGTPSYMSPEQFRGDPVDGRSDVFSAAIVLYQLLTGERAFFGSATVVMQQILNQMPAPPSKVNPELDPALDAILARALAKLPDQRYASAQQFLDALQGRPPSAAAYAFPTVLRAPDAVHDDDRTMLAGQDGWPAVTSAFGTGTASGSATLTPWKLAMLPGMETLLTDQIGPLAKLLLKRAAAGAADFDALCAALLPHIPSERARHQFAIAADLLKQHHAAAAPAPGERDAVGLDTAGAVGTSGTSGTGGVDASAASVAGYDQAFADATQRRLALAVGPIAKVLVNRTARGNVLRADFLELLSRHIESEPERMAFLHDMRVFGIDK